MEGLKQDFMKVQEKWRRTRNRSASTERLQKVPVVNFRGMTCKRGEAMFGAEDEYKEEKAKLEEELACFRQQKTDYFDHIGISVSQL